MKERKFSDKFIWITASVLVCMLVAFLFCAKKEGYHEDEYYSYYSTARSAGLAVEDQAWKPTEEILREYAVQPGEGFRYGFVKEVQSWDVHPPVYYWMLHTVESLFPGRFSKWIGLSVNLPAFFLGLLLFAQLAGVVLQNEKMIPLAVLAYGLTPAALSGVTFIRMYAVLTVFVLWAAILHCRRLTDEKLSAVSFFLPLAVCTYLGFLTQYYYFIFLFFLAAGFCIYRLLAYRDIKGIVCYAMTMILVFGAAFLTYPAFPGQMFRGQRGAQATASFFELSNTWSRLCFFFGLINKYAFGGILLLVMALIPVILLVAARLEKERQIPLTGDKKVWWLLAGSAFGYFLTVSKTGLLLGDSSIRYQMPVCGILILLVLFWFRGREKPFGMACAVVLILVNVYSLLTGSVLFLYEEDAEKAAFAGECAEAGIPAVYFYDDAETWCIWDSTDELLQYQEVFFCDQSADTPITDPRIAESRRLAVYISSLQDETASVERIFACNPYVAEYRLLYRDTYCNMYLFK